MSYIEFFFRYFHVLAGIVWIGMLYYFNFVQTEYFKEAEAGAKSDAMAKLAPRALYWPFAVSRSALHIDTKLAADGARAAHLAELAAQLFGLHVALTHHLLDCADGALDVLIAPGQRRAGAREEASARSSSPFARAASTRVLNLVPHVVLRGYGWPRRYLKLGTDAIIIYFQVFRDTKDDMIKNQILFHDT